MGFIFKENKPFLGNRAVSVIHFHRDDDGAGVDFIGLLHILEFSFFFQLAHTHESQIHQADKLVLSSLENIFPGIQVALIGAFYGCPVVAFPEFHILQLRGKSGVTAMIGPIRIEDTYLRHGGISVFVVHIVILNMLEIPEGHSKPQGIIKFSEFFLLQVPEAVKNLHILRLLKICFQCFRLNHIRFPGIHRVDTVGFYPVKFFIRQLTGDQVGHCGPDNWIFFFI